MTAIFKVSNPDAVVMEATFSMTLEEWKRLRAQATSGHHTTDWPMWDFLRQIDSMVSKAEQAFRPDPVPDAARSKQGEGM